MGEVYRARDTRLGREVAIKVLSADQTSSAEAQRRFEQEARAVAALSHPNILSLHHFETENGISFAVTELLQGQTLRERVEAGKLRWIEAVQIGAAICDGLAAAHEKGIIHRDLKPSNIFLTSDGQVKILDFGLARISSAADEGITDLKTAPGTVMGTLGYMSPEQLRGEEVDATTDIFALGCILYEAISGKSPFGRSTTTETIAAVLRDDTPTLQDVPPSLTQIIGRCLEKSPTQRYHSARDLALDLRSVLTERPKHVRFTFFAGAAAVALVAALAVMLMRRQPPPVQHQIRSILILPFENESHDPGAEYLSDGIAEGLISKLAELPNVRVIARTTAFQFKGKPVDLPRLRRELAVDGVLSGRLLSRANNVVVQADLIDAVAGTEVWGNRFHEESADVLNIEQDIVGRISEALRVRLTPAQQSRIAAPSTRNPEAYKLYLQGRFYWNKRNGESIRKASELFEEAVTIDPQFALAYSGLADAYNMLANTYRTLPAEDGRLRSRKAVETALRLDPNLAEAHASLGLIESNRFHWDRGEAEFKRAMELNPNHTDTLLWYALLLEGRGDVNGSMNLLRKAEQIDPLSAIIVANVARMLSTNGDYATALVEAEKARQIDPGYWAAHWNVAMACEGLGKIAQGVAAYRKAAEISAVPGYDTALRAHVAMILGDRSEARRLALILEQQAAAGKVLQMAAGWAFSAAGDRDRAFACLNRAFDAREPPLRNNIRTPMTIELRSDPRYAALLRRLERGFQN